MKYRLIGLVFIGINYLWAMDAADKIITIKQVERELSFFIENVPFSHTDSSLIDPEEYVRRALSDRTIGENPISLSATNSFIDQLARNPNNKMKTRMQTCIKKNIKKRFDQEREKLDLSQNKTAHIAID